MTPRDSIEETLRRPAPDEPAVLPALRFAPSVAARVRGTTRSGTTIRNGRDRWPLVVVGALAIASLAWQLAGSGASGPASSAAPATPTISAIAASDDGSAGLTAVFSGGGLTFSYPSTWQAHASQQAWSRGSAIAIVGSADLSSCGSGSIDMNCAYAASLGPGDVLVFVARAASPGGSVEEPPGGFAEFVDGMPAVVTTLGPIAQTGQDEGRAWQIGMPGIVDNWYVVTGSYRGPGVETLGDQVDALARSIRFDHPAASLPTDSASIDALVATAVDALDRDARESYHSTYYACFPRRVGSSEPIVIEDGPGGPLVGPIRVTCTISMEPEAVGLFAMTLAASWEAGPGYSEGTHRQVAEVKADGTLGGMQSFNETFFPSTRPLVTPGPATTPIALTEGSLVEVLFPGVMFYAEPNRSGSLSELPHGERLWIVSGPLSVAGENWYRVQWQPTPTYDGIPGWMPDTLDGHPVVAPVAARCPTIVDDVIDLVGLIPAERIACFEGRDITIGPVVLGPTSNKTFPATGSPGWLAGSATIAMFGAAGPAGVDGPLLVRADPSVGHPPVDTWLEVTGHFDDPAAASCQRGWMGAAGETPLPETASEQVLSCREQFVITAVRAVPGP